MAEKIANTNTDTKTSAISDASADATTTTKTGSQISQEQYDAYVEQIRQGNTVLLKGRRAKTIDELHFALDADDGHAPEYLPPAIPMILGLPTELQAQGLAEQVQTLTERNAALVQENGLLDAVKTRMVTEKQQAQAAQMNAEAANQTLQQQLDAANAELARRKDLLDSLQNANDGLVAELKTLKGTQVPSPDAVTQSPSPTDGPTLAAQTDAVATAAETPLSAPTVPDKPAKAAKAEAPTQN